MIPALSTRANRIRTLILLLVAVGIGSAALIEGVSDNPPGIALMFLAAAAFLLSFAHPWRRSVQFRYLFYACGAGFVVAAILHNVLDMLAHMAGGIAGAVLGVVGAGAFLVAVLLCPSGLVVGGIGAIAMAIRSWRLRAHGAAA